MQYNQRYETEFDASEVEIFHAAFESYSYTSNKDAPRIWLLRVQNMIDLFDKADSLDNEAINRLYMGVHNLHHFLSLRIPDVLKGEKITIVKKDLDDVHSHLLSPRLLELAKRIKDHTPDQHHLKKWHIVARDVIPDLRKILENLRCLNETLNSLGVENDLVNSAI